jgi:hypothetical protein
LPEISNPFFTETTYLMELLLGRNVTYLTLYKVFVFLYVDWKSRMVATSGQHLPLTLIGKNVWETYSS